MKSTASVSPRRQAAMLASTIMIINPSAATAESQMDECIDIDSRAHPLPLANDNVTI
jgi:hypothetical protein